MTSALLNVLMCLLIATVFSINYLSFLIRTISSRRNALVVVGQWTQRRSEMP